MLRNITMCTALAGLLTGGLLVGCEEAEAPPPYELEISFSPEQPVPGRSTRIGRQPFGRIVIANADSAPGADAKTAMMMAHRAVNELV